MTFNCFQIASAGGVPEAMHVVAYAYRHPDSMCGPKSSVRAQLEGNNRGYAEELFKAAWTVSYWSGIEYNTNLHEFKIYPLA